MPGICDAAVFDEIFGQLIDEYRLILDVDGDVDI
jgi:hypothetical protein